MILISNWEETERGLSGWGPDRTGTTYSVRIEVRRPRSLEPRKKVLVPVRGDRRPEHAVNGLRVGSDGGDSEEERVSSRDGLVQETQGSVRYQVRRILPGVRLRRLSVALHGHVVIRVRGRVEED